MLSLSGLGLEFNVHGRAIDCGLARCKSSHKLQETSNFCIGLKQSVNSCVMFETARYRSWFNEFVSLFLTEICPSDSFRPFPPRLGNGQSVDLLKLFFIVKEKGGYDSVSERGLWNKVGEEYGLSLGTGPAIKLVYVKHLDLLERELLARVSEIGGFNFKRFQVKCEMHCVDNHASSEMSGNQKISSDDEFENVANKSSANSDEEMEMEMLTHENPRLEKDVIISHKRKRSCLSRMLHWMVSVAKDPTELGIGSLPQCSKFKSYGNNEYWKQVLSVRRLLFLTRPAVCNAQQFVSKKKQRMHPSMYRGPSASTERLRSSSSRLLFETEAYPSCQSSSGPTSDANASSPPDNDISFMKTMWGNENHKRKRIKIGSYFQADVPEWSGKEAACESDSKWLGTRVWPLEKEKREELKLLIERDPVGKGRVESCGCENCGSVECVRFHVAERRSKLKLENGSAFYNWHFDKMGEEVALSWTEDEDKRFKATVKAGSCTSRLSKKKKKCFWKQTFKSLPRKTRRDQISYYYNVFLIQQRAYQNRCTSRDIDIDSDDDEIKFVDTNSIQGGSCQANR
ncbi:hypothetical protein Dimus_006561 [Dionaea muscipula]